MRRVFISILSIVISGSLMLSDVNAQSRSEIRRPQTSRKESSGNIRKDHGGNTSRPGNGNIHRPYRPGGSYRPTPTPPPQHRPGPSHRPSFGHRPVYVKPPYRPYRMPARQWVRPVPPRTWRPIHTNSLLSGFLGLRFGISFNTALENLYTSGYSVDGYGNDCVYLRGINEQGVYWDDATLYFSGNRLTRSEFYKSASYSNPSNYYNLCSNLTTRYGAPVYQQANGQTLSSQWFGYNGDYITLQYTPMACDRGLRYFTIMTYGN